MSMFQKLTELQKKVGYKNGPINLIALFGLFAESGEVLEEWYNSVKIFSPLFDENIFDAIKQSKHIDNFKKEIRDNKISDSSWWEPGPILGDNFDKELADALYYLNALAINRGYTLEYYAQLSYDKVSAKIQKNIANNVDHLEMPRKIGEEVVSASDNNDRLLKGDYPCKECENNSVPYLGYVCNQCEARRNQ